MWVFRNIKRRRPNALSNIGAVDVWEVGYYDTLASDGTGGNFIVLYEFDKQVDAAQQVHFLNGGN